MPTYIEPKLVHVEPRSGNPVTAVSILAVMGYATWQVADLLASMIAAILAAVAVTTAASLVTLAVVLRRQYGRTHLDAPQWVTERLGAPRVRSSAAIADRPAPVIVARSPRAIEAPAIHYHLHLHGVPQAQPVAIEEER